MVPETPGTVQGWGEGKGKTRQAVLGEAVLCWRVGGFRPAGGARTFDVSTDRLVQSLLCLFLGNSVVPQTGRDCAFLGQEPFV